MDNKSEQIYRDLHEKYKRNTITKHELAKEMSVGISTLSKYMKDGIGLPNYVKVGTSKNAKVLFPIREVAEFLSQTIRVL